MTLEHRFFLKYCPNGHMVWSDGGEVTQPRCSKCGEELLSKCESCSALIPNSWKAFYLSSVGQPANFPRRPDHCPKCGAAYPWAETFNTKLSADGFWDLLHPVAAKLSKSRYESGHYGDAVEAIFKEINMRLKKIHKTRTGDELDGVALMRKAFSPKNPTLILGDLTTETGTSIQQGYLDIFAGSMAAIRNPKAHSNVTITKEEAIHLIMLGSLLLKKLDEAVKP